MVNPLVSIITPVYNCEKFIEETINSVLNQTYTNWEHLIVDDCSTDNSWQIILKYSQKDKRIRPFRLDKNSGAGIARNYAIKNAQGKYIAFLDSDDIWIPVRLEKHIYFMMMTDVSFSHSSYGYLNDDGKILPRKFFVSSQPVDYKSLLKKTEIGCLTAVYDQEKIGKFYMPDLRKKQDYALWLSILKTGIKSTPYPEILAYYRLRKGSQTSNKFNLVFQHFRFLRHHEKLSNLSSLKYTLYWAFNGMLKYYL